MENIRFVFGRVTAGNEQTLILVNVGALKALVAARAVNIDANFRPTPPRGSYQFASVFPMEFRFKLLRY